MLLWTPKLTGAAGGRRRRSGVHVPTARPPRRGAIMRVKQVTTGARRGQARPAGGRRPASAQLDQARRAGRRAGTLHMWGNSGLKPGGRPATRQQPGCTGRCGAFGGRAGRACSWPRRPRRHARRCRASQAKRPASSLATASAARRSATSCRGARRVRRQGRKPSAAYSMQAAGAGLRLHWPASAPQGAPAQQLVQHR